jgi:hypothetical protein
MMENIFKCNNPFLNLNGISYFPKHGELLRDGLLKKHSLL